MGVYWILEPPFFFYGKMGQLGLLAFSLGMGFGFGGRDFKGDIGKDGWGWMGGYERVTLYEC